MRDSLAFIPMILICIAMMLVAIPRKKSYTVTTECSIKQKTITTVTHTNTNYSLNPKATKTLFNRETKEILDMDGNVIAIADTFYVDDNNKITKIIETFESK